MSGDASCQFGETVGEHSTSCVRRSLLYASREQGSPEQAMRLSDVSRTPSDFVSVIRSSFYSSFVHAFHRNDHHRSFSTVTNQFTGTVLLVRGFSLRCDGTGYKPSSAVDLVGGASELGADSASRLSSASLSFTGMIHAPPER